MILLIDNYDSFTYNVYQYLRILSQRVKVIRNDKIDIKMIERMSPEKIVISPGPGTPLDAGICIELVQKFSGKIPILGICLGHQAIAQAFGGKVVRARRMSHGKVSDVYHSKRGLYKGLPSPTSVTRYHSLIVEKSSLPSCFRITSETEDGVIMGIKHRKFSVEGIQFHPESYMTVVGMEMLKNFVSKG